MPLWLRLSLSSLCSRIAFSPLQRKRYVSLSSSALKPTQAYIYLYIAANSPELCFAFPHSLKFHIKQKKKRKKVTPTLYYASFLLTSEFTP